MFDLELESTLGVGGGERRTFNASSVAVLPIGRCEGKQAMGGEGGGGESVTSLRE